MTDLDLMTASGKGDSRAFGRLVERHHAAVTAVAFAVTRDLATSERIAQARALRGYRAETHHACPRNDHARDRGAMIETNGRVNRVGRKAAAEALPMRLAVPAAATCAAIAIITGVVWLL